MKLRLTELNGELNEARDQMAALDVEVSKLTNKCQVRQIIVLVSGCVALMCCVLLCCLLMCIVSFRCFVRCVFTALVTLIDMTAQ